MNVLCPDTRYGPMLYNRGDPFFTQALELYGEWSWAEVICWSAVVSPGAVCISAGANIGCHVVALAQLVGKEGGVIAFEPQRPMYNLAIANAALCNVDSRVRLHNAALGQQHGMIEVPDIDYEKDNTFGGLSLCGHTDVPSDAPRYKVPLVTIDAIGLPRCDLIQLDIEGMEIDALAGAQQTIARCRPLLYLEVHYDEEQMREAVAELGYHAYWHRAPLFNPHNYRGEKKNVWGETVSISWLCAPRGVDLSYTGLKAVDGLVGP